MGRRLALLSVLAFLAGVSTAARPAPYALTERLAALGRVWLTAKFAHPRVALTGRDWDAALVAVLPPVKSAGDDKAFADAVGAMLASIV